MSRIRSVKPQFFNHEVIDKLSDGCALFFIGMWCHCDDEGKVKDSPRQLHLLMPRFRTQDIVRWIAQLEKQGSIQRGELTGSPRTSSGELTGWLRVTGWKNQRINRPQDAEVKSSEITWITRNDSLNGRERSVNIQCKDRIGEERRGEDRRDTASVKPRRMRAPQIVASEGDLSLALEWLNYAREVMPWQKSFTQEKFAADLAKVKNRTDLNDDGIRAVLKFVSTDYDFWRNNAVSPIGLLKVGKNGLRKIDTILSQMKPKEDGLKRALADFVAGTVAAEETPF